MKTSMILARDIHGLIGIGDNLPWRCPADLALFKAYTLNTAIVMGRKTWESLPVKPLPGRINIVVTSDVTKVSGAHAVVNSVERAVEAAELFKDQVSEIVFIGGSSIYNQVVEYVDEVSVSEMNLSVNAPASEAVYFDYTFHHDHWKVVKEETVFESETGKELFEHTIYVRK